MNMVTRTIENIIEVKNTRGRPLCLAVIKKPEKDIIYPDHSKKRKHQDHFVPVIKF